MEAGKRLVVFCAATTWQGFFEGCFQEICVCDSRLVGLQPDFAAHSREFNLPIISKLSRNFTRMLVANGLCQAATGRTPVDKRRSKLMYARKLYFE